MSDTHTVYFISDQTGITAEALGNSLLAQFPDVHFDKTTIPFIDTTEKAHNTVYKINEAGKSSHSGVIIFSTIVNEEIREIISASDGLTLDFFNTFLGPLEQQMKLKSTLSVGKTHAIVNYQRYENRIDAVNFALNHDDGQTTKWYDKAEVILIGISRCGKTPTSLYLALQFGIYAANYPLINEDLDKSTLPQQLLKYKDKLFGLTISADRLTKIRSERKADSQYASLNQCIKEIRRSETLMNEMNVPFINTTNRSIEEIATTIMAEMDLKRHSF